MRSNSSPNRSRRVYRPSDRVITRREFEFRHRPHLIDGEDAMIATELRERVSRLDVRDDEQPHQFDANLARLLCA
ncbi:MAG: hypothetical protein NTX72_04910 [Candidatus Uhrbacteria bacterium]|nr:hypothetical protein [Candidatus Uhrbacteria bacterium]